jgi:transcriptional regulator
MYLPRPFVMDPAEVRSFAAAAGSLELITAGTDGVPWATRLPFVWEGDTVRMHLARPNPHVAAIRAGSHALAVISGAEAYVSPSFYPAKAEHGRVVPTLNYSAVHLRGTATLIEDAAWLHAHVRALSDLYEAAEACPWSVDDAPGDFIDQHLRGIVGVELRVTGVEAKAKWSQNRSAADQAGVVAGLQARGDDAGLDQMRSAGGATTG